MVKICNHCSNVDVKQLEELIPAEKLTVGCIENCAAYKEKSYGYINDELVVTETSEEFLEKVRKEL